ncbi:unnamed protein product [Phytophthora fragariaefolia]|uniref:Unnamed protein product n=1 Tax=Phytophthora fragariaefolia TaxID=1490495 RepID=A0A9W6X0S0_9STRA|nr:unnamed protein product [Phytophthora fragariaefolia]
MTVDEFGREHYVVEAPAGRLGILLFENERGFIIVQGFGEVQTPDDTFVNESAKQQLLAMRQVVQMGDRLVAINSDEVVHCSLSEVICHLGKLSAIKRQLKFARYHQGQRTTKRYDPEKLVIVRAPSGPLGLVLSNVIHYGAVIDDFQQLSDGSESHLKKYLNVHRGCQIVEINGVDVSELPREEVAKVLAEMRAEDKEMVLYRMTPNTCARFSKLTISSGDMSINFTETENFRCVVAVAVAPEVEPGDVLIGINGVNLTSSSRAAAIEILAQTPLPQILTFYHDETAILPECHSIQINAWPSGLNLDISDPTHARLQGLTTPEDADRPEYKHLADFIPGSYIITVNGLDVHQYMLEDISRLLSKLGNACKQIVVGNMALINRLEQTRLVSVISVPPGPLGIKFDGGHDDVARVAGFNVMADGNPGIIQQSGQVPVGSILHSVNKMNVTCLTMSQTVALLQKMASAPKQLVFLSITKNNTRTVSIRVPPGPLGIDLRTTPANTVAVDRLNTDPVCGPTHIFDHGGVVSGSEILAIDGFDVTSLHIADLSQLLRLLASHEKIITFGTTVEAYDDMLNSDLKSTLTSLVVTKSPMGIQFDSLLENAACTTNVFKSDCNQEIPPGSRLIAIDHVDIRALSLNEIIGILKSLGGVEKTLTFDTKYHQTAPITPTAIAPSSPTLKKILKGTPAGDRILAASPQQTISSSSTPNALTTKATVRFAEVDPLQESLTQVRSCISTAYISLLNVSITTAISVTPAITEDRSLPVF